MSVPAWDLEYGNGAEELGELSGIQRGGRHDELHIKSLLHHIPQNTEQYIGMQGPFVGLIHDDTVVLIQLRIAKRLAQQHAVCHVLDLGLLCRTVLKSNGVANHLPQLTAHLFAHSLGHGHRSDATRLGAADHAGVPIPLFQQVLRQLCGLSGTRFADNDDDLMFTNNLSSRVDTQKQELALAQRAHAGSNSNAALLSQHIILCRVNIAVEMVTRHRT